MYHVSTKTVSRWRKQGLPSRRILFGKRKRVAISRKALERFAQKTGKQERLKNWRKLPRVVILPKQLAVETG